MDADLLADTFVALSDTMVADFDVIDFLHMLTDRSARLLSASAAGVVLADPRGELRVAAASSDEAGLLELFQVQNDQGPCLACVRTGQPVTVTDLAGPGQRWPRFAAAATSAGFGAVNAVPMRLRDQVVGALNLFSAGNAPLSPAELRIAQALADVATIGLLQERNVRRAETLAEQLQAALNSRVVIEQAKGRIAERTGLDVGQAFTLLRQHARTNNQRLTDVARYVIDSPTADLPAPAPRINPRQADTAANQRPTRSG
jgi:GAF domain-containing protein